MAGPVRPEDISGRLFDYQAGRGYVFDDAGHVYGWMSQAGLDVAQQGLLGFRPLPNAGNALFGGKPTLDFPVKAYLRAIQNGAPTTALTTVAVLSAGVLETRSTGARPSWLTWKSSPGFFFSNGLVGAAFVSQGNFPDLPVLGGVAYCVSVWASVFGDGQEYRAALNGQKSSTVILPLLPQTAGVFYWVGAAGDAVTPSPLSSTTTPGTLLEPGPLDGSIGRLVAYNRVLTDRERSQVESRLCSAYALPSPYLEGGEFGATGVSSGAAMLSPLSGPGALSGHGTGEALASGALTLASAGSPTLLPGLPLRLRFDFSDRVEVTPMYVLMNQGDRRPSIKALLVQENGDPVDLTGCSVRFLMGIAGQAPAVNAAAAIDDAPGGKVHYDWAPGDTASAGTFRGQFEVTYPDGTALSAPTTSYMTVVVQASVDGA